MRSFLGAKLARTSIVALCVIGGTIGCGGSDTSGTAPDDTGDETVETGGDETAVDSGDMDSTDMDSMDMDSGAETSDMDSTTDSGAGDTAADTAMGDTTVADSATDSVSVDSVSVDSVSVDSVSVDSVSVDTAIDAVVDAPTDTATCTPGSLCPDGTICSATGACTPCTTDTQCSTASAGTLCYSGTCETGTCHPKPATTSGCSTAGAACCATATTGGSCFATAGKTSCCADSDCTGLTATTTCDTATHTCACPAPTPGFWYVAPTGTDTTTLYAGNGSQQCPFKTIAKAVTMTTSAASAVDTTIVLANGTDAAPNVYGTGCTGGGTCDTAGITVPSTFSKAVTFKGAGTRNQTVVAGTTGAGVFNLQANDSITALTIQPANAAQHGIVYSGAAATTAGTVTNVTITGLSGTTTTGAGILVKGSANPSLGGGTTGGLGISGGTHGILVQETATPTLNGTTGAPTLVSNATTSCIRLENTSTSAAPSINASGGAITAITLKNCNTSGGLGAVVVDTGAPGTGSVFNNITIARDTTAAAFNGLEFRTAAKVTLSNIFAATPETTTPTTYGPGLYGIRAANSASVTVTANVDVSGNGGGVYVTDSALVTLHGVTANRSGRTGAGSIGGENTGIRCESLGTATIKVRSSTTLNNVGNGVHSKGCQTDLNASGDAGNNVFNKTSARNLLSGVCYEGANASVDVGNATWSCDYSGASCVSSSSPSPTTYTPPSSGVTFACKALTDLSYANGKSFADLPYQCCN